MSRKSRMFALAGLVAALAVGTTAVGAWSRNADGCDVGCPGSGCPALVRKAPHINRTKAAARKKTVYIKKIHETKTDTGCCCASKNKTKAGCGCQSAVGAPAAPGCCGVGTCAPLPGVVYPAPVCTPYAPCGDVMMPVPPPVAPPTMVTYPVTTCKQYRVELKLTESRKGESDHVVATPTVCVCEGHTAHVSAGLSHADLCKKNVPQNEMGHEGHDISVTISPCPTPEHVTLACWIWTSEREHGCCDGTYLSESRLHTTTCVKLGKATKFHCDRVCGSAKVGCCLEVTVKEHAEETPADSVSSPTPFNDTDLCHPGCISGARENCAEYKAPQAEITRVTGVKADVQENRPTVATWCAPAPQPVVATGAFAPRQFRVCEVPNPECGKIADAQGPCQVLEVCCHSTKLTCDKTTLTQEKCCPVTVTVRDGKIHVTDGWFEATADALAHEVPNVLTLKGNVEVLKSRTAHLIGDNNVLLPLTPVPAGWWWGPGFSR